MRLVEVFPDQPALVASAIEQKYRELGYSKGWTFLACPEERLFDARVAVIGLNPGGGGSNDSYAYREVWSCENNSFCEDESQHRDQVREWHHICGVTWDETLSAQFIPFRSPDIDKLGNRPEAIAFARQLWTWALDRSPASLLLVMGNDVAWHIADILGAKEVASNLPTNWDPVTIDVWETGSGRRIVKMPHPSRYKLFGRGEASEIAEASLRCAAGVVP